MQTPGLETLELDAQGREGIVLDVALPVLAAWSRSVRVVGFRPSMGISGLTPRESARLRTLSLATGSRATGIFEGANDFRMNFPSGGGLLPSLPSTPGLEADLDGHPLAPIVSDLVIASFGASTGTSRTHRLRGLTHVRGASGQGYSWGAVRALGREFGLDLQVALEELGFEPQGLGRVAVKASRSAAAVPSTDWKDRGEIRSVRVVLGGVRPRTETLDRIETELKEALWESRRIAPDVLRLITPGVDPGAFLEIEVECERGGATFTQMVARVSAPLSLARRAARKALAFLDSPATCDERTGILVLAAAAAAGASLELALAPSDDVSEVCALLRDLGVRLDEEPSPGLVLLRLESATRVRAGLVSVRRPTFNADP